MRLFVFNCLRNFPLSTWRLALCLFACLPAGGCLLDPCAGVSCSNGGYCVDGSCACPAGFSGTYCQTREPARFLSVSSVDINNFPLLNPSGRAWDNPNSTNPAAGPPDLVVQVFADGALVGRTNTLYDVLSSRQLYFNGSFYIPVGARVEVILYDDDGALGLERIGGYYFYPNNYHISRPASISLYNVAATHQINMLIHCNWHF